MPFFSLVQEATRDTRINFSTDSRPLEITELKIAFTDGRVGIFDKEQMGQLTYFKNKDLESSSFQFEFSLETFFKVLELSIGKKMFREVADLNDPFVVENMEKALLFFTSKEETQQILSHFEKAELPIWSFGSALRVAEAYRKSSPKGKESFYIRSVYEVIISGLLLGSEEQIYEHFHKYSIAHADSLYAPMAIRNLEEKLVKAGVADKATQDKLETSKNKYAEAQKSYNPLKFSTATLAQKQSLLQYIPDDQMSSEPYEKIDFPFIAEAKKKADPKARPLPIDAKDPLFRKFLMQTLCDLTNNACNIDGIQGNSGADMSRKDLLEHMRGPKNHLLLHYGFQLRQSGDLKYPYFIRHNGVTEFFGYDFKTNTTPVDLEEEMRADLKALFGASYPLPPKLIPGERTPGVVPQSELISTMPASNPLQLYLNSMGHPPATR